MAYQKAIPDFVQRSAADGLAVANTVILNSTGNKNPVALMDEMKGGLHYVEYLEYLSENSARGVSVARRAPGMMVYVEKHYNGGADAVIGRYYQLKTLAGNGDATWEPLSFTGATITPNNTFPVADIASRDALTGLATGDIVIVRDASGDATVVPALTGGATYIFTGDASTPWLRFLYPDDPRLHESHQQNTDTAFNVVFGTLVLSMSTRTLYDHLHDASIHFKINDESKGGSSQEVYSSAKLNRDFLKVNPEGSPTKFFNELGQAVEVQASLTRINGGSAATQF